MRKYTYVLAIGHLIYASLCIGASQSYKLLKLLESKVLLNNLLGTKDSKEYDHRQYLCQ